MSLKLIILSILHLVKHYIEHKKNISFVFSLILTKRNDRFVEHKSYLFIALNHTFSFLLYEKKKQFGYKINIFSEITSLRLHIAHTKNNYLSYIFYFQVISNFIEPLVYRFNQRIRF